LLKNGILAGDEMDRRRQEVEEKGIKDTSELTAPFDMNNPIFVDQQENRM
jgi:hypothetical protein